MKWLLAGFIFWAISSMIGAMMNLPVEQFMLDIKAASNSVGVIALVIVSICLVTPVMEELVFRGWLFRRIGQTKLGDIGALILTAIIFTVIHSQYEHNVSFIIMLAFGLLLGFIRYKSNNISYSIVTHMFFNSLAIVTLFI